MQDKQKISLLRSGAIGDLVQITPSIKLLRANNPEAEIIFICGKSSAAVLENCPYIDKLLTFDDQAIYAGSSFKKSKETYKISKLIKGSDLCFVLHEDKRWSIPAMLAGVKDIRNLNSVSEYTGLGDRCAKLVSGRIDENPVLEFFPTESKISGLPNEYITIAPGGARNAKNNNECRRWAGFEDLSQMILNQTNQNIVFVGKEEDSICMTHDRITDLCGKTSLSDIYHIIDNSKLFIGNDSGLLHIACCTKTSKIGMFTATDPDVILGRNTDVNTIRSELHCSPCEIKGDFRTDCNNECRKSVTPLQVFHLAKKMGSL